MVSFWEETGSNWSWYLATKKKKDDDATAWSCHSGGLVAMITCLFYCAEIEKYCGRDCSVTL